MARACWEASDRDRSSLTRDASHFDTVQFRHSAISTQKRHFDTETLQKASHFDTALDVSTHFLTNAYLCLFMGFYYMDFVLVDLKIP